MYETLYHGPATCRSGRFDLTSTTTMKLLRLFRDARPRPSEARARTVMAELVDDDGDGRRALDASDRRVSFGPTTTAGAAPGPASRDLP